MNTVIFRMALTVLLLSISITTNAQTTQPRPKPVLRDGETWVNPRPGVIAPGMEVSGRTVTASRGYGDASLGYFINWVTAYAQTVLNNFVSRPHQICARISQVEVSTIIIGGNPYPVCSTTSGGGRVQDSYGPFWVNCGAFVAVRSVHSIYRAGAYDWSAEDFDGFTFCS
jgi:hypothetical protein